MLPGVHAEDGGRTHQEAEWSGSAVEHIEGRDDVKFQAGWKARQLGSKVRLFCPEAISQLQPAWGGNFGDSNTTSK